MKLRASLLSAFMLLALAGPALGWHPLVISPNCDGYGISTDKAEADMTIEFGATSAFTPVLDTDVLQGSNGHYSTFYPYNGDELWVRWKADHNVVSHATFDHETKCQDPTPSPTPSSTPTPTPTSSPTPTPTGTPDSTPTPTTPSEPSSSPPPSASQSFPSVTLPPTATDGTTPPSSPSLLPLLILAMVSGFAVAWRRVR